VDVFKILLKKFKEKGKHFLYTQEILKNILNLENGINPDVLVTSNNRQVFQKIIPFSSLYIYILTVQLSSRHIYKGCCKSHCTNKYEIINIS